MAPNSENCSREVRDLEDGVPGRYRGRRDSTSGCMVPCFRDECKFFTTMFIYPPPPKGHKLGFLTGSAKVYISLIMGTRKRLSCEAATQALSPKPQS